MNDVLHVQTRAYPLHYGSVDTSVSSVLVPGLGTVHPVIRVLGSQVYNQDVTVEVDLTGLVSSAVHLSGTEIISCHAQILGAGTVLVTYALRHTTDLLSFDPHALAAFDARINNVLREADAPVLGRALRAVEAAGVLRHTIAIPGDVTNAGPSVLDNRAVRYNCHFLAADPPWEPDARASGVVVGQHCHILLPYTYAWECDPATPTAEIRAMLEPADLTVAQMSLLFSASLGGRRIMAELSQARPGKLDENDFRRFLDRVWANYHELDAYRMESAQESRATYLAARETMGLDAAFERAERLLTHVSASLLAESSLRSQQLDARLNRAAASLTVVVATGLIVDLASYLLPGPGPVARVSVLATVIVLAALGLWLTVRTAHREGRRSARGRRAAPGQPSVTSTTHPADQRRSSDLQHGAPLPLDAPLPLEE